MASRPKSLKRSVSPPPIARKASISIANEGEMKRIDTQKASQAHFSPSNPPPTLAAIEAGETQIHDHLSYFVSRLSSVSRRNIQLDIKDFQQLYVRNQHKHGHHFVVHQHDHPISGVHYDLRLQFSETSTISFAIPYGLPGHPNSVRPNRMAIETRVHNLWNNLIESASHATGSLLIWDTGEYEILPRKEDKLRTTDDELSDGGEPGYTDSRSHSERLFSGFQGRHIKLRLCGQRLPPSYTISLRLPSANDHSKQPRKPSRKRRRIDPGKTKVMVADATDSDTEEDVEGVDDTSGETIDDTAVGVASDDNEDATIRANNAYPGANNTIGSIHQRHWFLTLDKRNSGFRKARSGPEEGRWVGAWEPFFVCGRDYDRSVVTGRTADEVMEDESVEKFVGRKMWRPILE